MIVFDLETTGLPKAEGSDLDMQPRIIEFGAIKLDKDLEEVDRLEFFCNPGHELDPQIIKITGITDEMLKDEKPFVANYLSLCEFFLGEKTIVAHNLPFDRKVLKFELERLDKLTKFPWLGIIYAQLRLGNQFGAKRESSVIFMKRSLVRRLKVLTGL